ncbi:MAG: hypothetical protein ACTSUE_25085 [Promethearchaeota archaeon]
MDFDELKLTRTYCECTDESENRCALCNRPLPFVDSPYGAIPTLALIKDYIKESSKYLRNKIMDLQDGVEGLVGPLVEQSGSKIKEMQDDLTRIIKEKIEDLDLRFEEVVIKKMEDIDLTYTNLKSLSKSVAQYFHEFIILINEVTASLFSLLDDFNDAKNAYITKLQPQIKEISDSLAIFNKILPDSKIFLNGPIEQEPSTMFGKNINPLSRAGLKRSREEFTSTWNKLIILGETSSRKRE